MQQEPITESFRLSPQQKRLWLWQRPGFGEMGIVKGCFLVDGLLNVQKLKEAVREIVRRYDILRTVFRCLPGVTIPVQVVLKELQVPILDGELVYPDQEARVPKLMELYDEIGRERFDLEHGPLVRFQLVRETDQKHWLLVCASTLCLDRPSLEVIIQQISHLYAAESGLPDSDVIQYPDFTEWQHSLIESEESATGGEFWRGQRQMDFHHVIFENHAFAGRSVQGHLALGVEFKQYCERHNVTPPLFFLACWQIFLRRVIIQDSKQAVAVEFNGRNYDELRNAIGPIARKLPVQQEPGNITARQLFEKTSELLEEIQQFQEYYSAEQFFSEKAATNNFFYLPFPFECQELKSEQTAGEVAFQVYKQDVCDEPYQLKLSCTEESNGWAIELHCDSALFTGENASALHVQIHSINCKT